jgi:hypothetical protein
MQEKGKVEGLLAMRKGRENTSTKAGTIRIERRFDRALLQ